MNEKIITYLAEVYGTNDAQSKLLLVNHFEETYNAIVNDVLVSEDSIYLHNGERDDEKSLPSNRTVIDVMALFCDSYVAIVSLQPEIAEMYFFMRYAHINTVSFNKEDLSMMVEDYRLEKVKGHPHWAMDAIRRNVLPRFKE